MELAFFIVVGRGVQRVARWVKKKKLQCMCQQDAYISQEVPSMAWSFLVLVVNVLLYNPPTVFSIEEMMHILEHREVHSVKIAQTIA